MFSIQTNVNSLIAQENLRVTSDFQGKTIQRLTSGFRINQSGDDAAGLSVANKFRSDVAELTQGVRNANDGISTLQIIDGGMNNVAKMLDRLKTLASQSASQGFTGDRKVVNDEFQTLLGEIDRQAQAIGLDQGGQYAKSLSVFVGGGRAAGTGGADTSNGTVSFDLTSSMVDTKSLSLKGMQVVAGTTDMSDSVQTIVGNVANTSEVAGYTDFFFAGAGFSDDSKIKVSVNLSSVGDMKSLVAAVNAAIQNAANDNTQAAAAFKAAGITASIHTGTGAAGDTAINTQQLAFTSTNAAFQVGAGDKMANALLGNATGTTGANLATTVTGSVTATTGSFTPTGKTVRIQGAGLAGPVDLTFSSNVTNISQAISDLVSKVSANAELNAAGISLTGSAGSALVFTNSRGDSFSVMATGDATNQLGLGAFVAGASGKVDYNEITGSSYNYGTAANDQATLQFSINGAAATAVTVELTEGDAVASARTTDAINNPNITASTASVTTGVTALATHDWSAANAAFTVTVNGGNAQTINLTTNFTLGTNNAALLTEINDQLADATASIDGTNHLVFTADKTGTTGSIAIGGTVTHIGATFNQTAATNGTDKMTFSVDGVSVTATLSGSSAGRLVGTGNLFDVGGTVTIAASTSGRAGGTAAVTAHDFGGGSGVFTVSVDGGTAQTVTLSTNIADIDGYIAAINPQLAGATATKVGNVLSIVSNSTGLASDIDLVDGANTPIATYLHLGAGVNGVAGNTQLLVSSDVTGHLGPALVSIAAGTYTGAQMVTAMNTALFNAGLVDNAGTPTSGVIASLDAGGDNLILSSSTIGASSSVSISAPPAVGGTTASALGGAATVGRAVGSAPVTAHDFGGGSGVFTVSVDGGAAQTVTLSTNITDIDGYIAAINPQLTGAHAVKNGTTLSITSDNTTGFGSSIVIADGANTPIASYLHLAAGVVGVKGGIGLAAGNDTGGSATAASVAAEIQSAINATTGTGATNAHATVTVNTNNSISITNDHKGAAHSVSAFTGNAAFIGTGATGAVAGANRSGTDMQDHLNQVFSSTAALQPAQFKATWTAGAGTAGTLKIESTNDTNFRINSGSTASGVLTGTADLTNGHDWNAIKGSFRLRVDGVLSNNINLSTDTNNATEVETAVEAALTLAAVTGVTVSMSSGHLVFTSDADGASSNIQVVGPSEGNSALATLGFTTLGETADADLGFGVSGSSFTSTNLSATTALNHVLDAEGASSAKNEISGNALTFTALKYGNDSQAITLSANDVDGTQRSITITLKNIDNGVASDNRAGRSIDEAISYINTKLQESNIATLEKIVAVKENKNGADQINFISSLSAFNVSVASTANADGVNGGLSANVDVGVVGEGSNVSVTTKEDALVAVTAISTAIGKLGSAQAAVGRGQNQLGYALSLAQSQISSFSAAESRIRDADVAAEAANLTKAQVLQQASIAAMAQANSAPQAILSLLRG